MTLQVKEAERQKLKTILSGLNLCKQVLLINPIKRMLTGLVRYMRAYPDIKGKLVRILAHFPIIDRVVLRLSRRVMNETNSPEMEALDAIPSSRESFSETEKHFFDLFEHQLNKKNGDK